jgi:hypothetical protein
MAGTRTPLQQVPPLGPTPILICAVHLSRFIAQARGECQYFSEETIPTAGEGCKSNALLRCCKDLGIASELWDPRFIREFKKAHCHEIWVEHVVTKKPRKIWTRKDGEPAYPFQVVKAGARM